MFKNRNLVKVSLVSVAITVIFSACSSGSSEVGFKGMNLGANADEVCTIVKQFADDNHAKYFKDNKGCRADLKLNGVFYQSGWLTANFNQDNVINKVRIGSNWSDILFNAKDLSAKNFAQALVDSKDWIDELKATKNPAKDYYSNVSNMYGFTDVENGWKIDVSGKYIELKSISKGSF
ncbi:MAG: hypothetical protein U9O86_04955 [Campylobacterota bacterium]|nr:hypothetical protein [Campylobacterota bacterium]